MEYRNLNYYCRIQTTKVEHAIHGMQHEKVVGQEDIPIDVWKYLGK